MSFLVPCIYRWIVVLGVESYFGTIGHCYAGAGGFSVLSFSCVEYYYQYRFHGRIVRRYPWRGYLSGASHVCTGVLCLLSFPRPSLCRDWTESALWQLWLCVYVGQCSLSAVVPYSSFIVVTSFETLFNQSEI